MVFELRSVAYGGKPPSDVDRGTGFSSALWTLLILTQKDALRHVLEAGVDAGALVFGTQEEQRGRQITESAKHLRLGVSFSNHPKHALKFAPNVAISWK